MAGPKEVLGEDDPGFTLWTSAHGFHHYTLSNRKGWRCIWAFLLLVLVISLISCVIYYFYHVFSTAVYSRVIMESPNQRVWPTTIICEKQGFTLRKINSVPSLTISHASLLSWSLAPDLSRPVVYATNTKIPRWSSSGELSQSLMEEINLILERPEFNGNYEKLLNAIAPNCTEFVLECTVENKVYTGKECCGTIIDSKPIFNRFGTCFTTKTAAYQHKVGTAGDATGLQIITMHDTGNALDRTYASPELFGASGVTYAITDDTSTIDSALNGQGQTVQPGQIASIGISRSLTDDSDLEFSAIGRMKCLVPGTRQVDEDLIFGLDQPYGYTKANCALVVKRELLARKLLDCSFASSGSVMRCGPLQSARYHRSFIDSNNSKINGIEPIVTDNEIQVKIDKECIQDCVQDRYGLTSSYTDLSDNLKADLQTKMVQAGATGTTNVVVLKFFLNSMEYSKIHNFPQHGLQFLAEVGGLMAFFLGISAVSIIECLCYFCVCIKRKCDGESDEEPERQQWKSRMNEVEDKDHARHQRQQQNFHEMEQKLRQLDGAQRI